MLLRSFSDESTEAQRESASLKVTQSEVRLDLPPLWRIPHHNLPS